MSEELVSIITTIEPRSLEDLTEPPSEEMVSDDIKSIVERQTMDTVDVKNETLEMFYVDDQNSLEDILICYMVNTYQS